MKQPRTTVTVPILDNNGDIVDSTISIALEGYPSGKARYGPINVCPITGEVMYEEDMIEYKGTLYSPEGAQEEIEHDDK